MPPAATLSPASSHPRSPAGKLADAGGAARPQRSVLIDVVRGIAIVLVVLGHVNQGNLHRGWWGTSTFGNRLENCIYSFHMPAFFFVSGIFLRPGVDKRGEWTYTLGKLRTMIYPYVVWSVLGYAAEHLFTRYMATTVLPLPQFLVALLTANFSWFLPTIFLVVMAGMLLRRLPMPAVFALAVVAQLLVPSTGASDIDLGIKNLPFLLLGMWLGRGYLRLETLSRPLSALGGCALLLALIRSTRVLTYSTRSLIVPLGVLGILMLLLLARALAHSGVARALAWAGEGSFGIFLMSEYPQGATRELLHRLGTTNPWAHLLFATAASVILPCLVYQYRERLRVGWLFVWPFSAMGSGSA